MARLLYNFIIGIYHVGIKAAALFNPKARAWIDGRKHNMQSLGNWRKQLPPSTPLLWMHCASLGEFEQGRPVLEQIRKGFPQYKIALSFYSPSGYEQGRNYATADWVGYLPADGKTRAQQWINVLQPTIAIFVKYEFWAEHLNALFTANIPTFLIAASFRKSQPFFKWYGDFFRQTLQGFQHIFTQSLTDPSLLAGIGIQACSFAGDPRIDRVVEIASSPVSFDKIAAFKAHEKLFIAGSSWPADEHILLARQHLWEKDWKVLLVPHEINEQQIIHLCQQIKLSCIRYSEIDERTDLSKIRIMIIDKVGLLSQLYRYGDLAYIGGGFGSSIHNTLEPAAFHLPILMGPKHQKFPEAVAFIQGGGAFVVHHTHDFQQCFLMLKKDDNRKKSSNIIREYIHQNQGASGKILKSIGQALDERAAAL